MLGLDLNPRENFILAMRHKEPYWLPCPTFDGSFVRVSHGIRELCDDGKDDWGTQWKRTPRSGPHPVNHPIDSPDMVEDYPFPSPDGPLLCKAKDMASKVDRIRVVLCGHIGIGGLFERSWILLGMPRFFVWSFRHPNALKRLIERIAEVKVTIAERLITEVGVDMISMGDDWGMEDRLMLSLERWRTFIKPWQAKIYKVAKEYGVPIWQHSDGRIEELIPDLIEMGINILMIQRECNNWPKIIEEYCDQITLWGGVSSRTLDTGDPEDVVNEVEECCRLGKRGGVILAPGHSLHTKENLEIMRKTWIEKGWYGVGRSPGS